MTMSKFWRLLQNGSPSRSGKFHRPIAPCANIVRRYWDLRLKWARFRNRIITMWKGRAPQRRARMWRIAPSVRAFARGFADWRNRPKSWAIMITATIMTMTTITITGMGTHIVTNMCTLNIRMRIIRMGPCG